MSVRGKKGGGQRHELCRVVCFAVRFSMKHLSRIAPPLPHVVSQSRHFVGNLGRFLASPSGRSATLCSRSFGCRLASLAFAQWWPGKSRLGHCVRATVSRTSLRRGPQLEMLVQVRGDFSLLPRGTCRINRVLGFWLEASVRVPLFWGAPRALPLSRPAVCAGVLTCCLFSLLRAMRLQGRYAVFSSALRDTFRNSESHVCASRVPPILCARRRVPSSCARQSSTSTHGMLRTSCAFATPGCPHRSPVLAVQGGGSCSRSGSCSCFLFMHPRPIVDPRPIGSMVCGIDLTIRSWTHGEFPCTWLARYLQDRSVFFRVGVEWRYFFHAQRSRTLRPI